METKDKKGLGIIAGAGVVGLAVLLATRAKAEPIPPGAEVGANIGIKILDAQGNEVPHNSSAELIEGESYELVVTVTNQSTKLGDPVAATLKLRTYDTVDPLIIPDTTESYAFAAGGSRDFAIPFDVAAGRAGDWGAFYAEVQDPSGAVLAAASQSVKIVAKKVSGTILELLIWHEGLDGWEDFVSGRQVPAGTDIHLAVMWKNTANFDIVGHIDLVTNGTELVAVRNQDKSAIPGAGWIVQFAPVSLAEGIHTFVATLSSDGVELDTVTFTLEATAEIVYGATVVIGI